MNKERVLKYITDQNIPAVDLIVDLLNRDETLVELIIKMDRANDWKGTHDS